MFNFLTYSPGGYKEKSVKKTNRTWYIDYMLLYTLVLFKRKNVYLVQQY